MSTSTPRDEAWRERARIADILNERAADPMWDAHAEVSKKLLTKAAELLVASAPAPAGGVEAVAVEYGWNSLSGLKLVISAWEHLPGGRNYSKSDVQRWLVEDMTPAIDAARAVIAGRQNDLLSDLVSRFATALLEKLRAAEKKYGFADDWIVPNWKADLVKRLNEHVAKGDPRDVAAYCAFAWHHGWSLSSAATSGSEGGPGVPTPQQISDYLRGCDAIRRQVLEQEALAKPSSSPAADFLSRLRAANIRRDAE